MNWKQWALTKSNSYAEVGSNRHQFICSDRNELEYSQEFPFSEYEYKYTLEEQKAQYQVILAARRWFQAMFLLEHGKAISLNDAFKIVDSK